MCKICSKLTIKTAERRQISSKGRSSVFIVNFEYVSHTFLMFLIVDFERVNVGWAVA